MTCRCRKSLLGLALVLLTSVVLASVVLASVVLASVVLASAAAEDIRYFRIGTAATTGTYFAIGGVIAGAISKPPGSRDCDHGGSCGVSGLVAVAQATQGSVENVLEIGDGRLESALGQADVVHWAYTGSGIFKGKPPITDLRAIGALFPESFHIVVRADSGIASLIDLKGKHVAMGEKESGTLVDARLILQAAGLSERDVKAENLRLAQAAEALGTGDIDALFILGGSPVPAIAELAAQTPIRLVPVPEDVLRKLTQKYRFLSPDVIPAGTYAGIETATPTLGIMSLWIVSAKVPDDLVYDITKALWHGSTRKLLEASHPMGRRIQLSTALEGLPVPLHPGAARFYREAGLVAADQPAAP